MRAKPTYKPPTQDRLTRSALHYLERYASSEANLRRVLERKVLKACTALELDPSDFSEMVDTVIEACVRNGLINDKTYAETKAAGLRRRGGSTRKIEAHLTAKGVDRATIEAVLQDNDQSDDNAAWVFARRRRLGPYRSSGKRAERRDKDLAAMCRAGFSFEIARRVIDAEHAVGPGDNDALGHGAND
ncbi:regulatory protein RecX [Roseibium sediminicola]|uniref:Regulatory protein RecX n=1 Tax=Roseibium sediminicola TaxID=2933272 RepID=A0ABT0GQC2_9HYPH|nr:RecX family transcriptional regulator [Roseibium sp. CAU 1639]MCK7611445.1 RecX family transcriptional regulator [Roseibium sp. CAU 1639]